MSSLMICGDYYDVALKIFGTGLFFVAMVWAFHCHKFPNGCEPKHDPWKTIPGAFAHALIVVGVLALIWTAPGSMLR